VLRPIGRICQRVGLAQGNLRTILRTFDLLSNPSLWRWSSCFEMVLRSAAVAKRLRCLNWALATCETVTPFGGLPYMPIAPATHSNVSRWPSVSPSTVYKVNKDDLTSVIELVT